ncbi:unnamed protein product [Neofusicoccum parvum]|uniref:Unnamed protein product n=1 Tax=Neofusicoccum parvum TaxID=310453 RepID=A0ACB5SEY1_9PEZI|nr:unnamed protein product [Neofusicoccum parvum]
MSSQVLLTPCLAIMGKIATSNSFLLDPERNPVLKRLLRVTVYDHFCAGTNMQELGRTVRRTKAMGFRGVILGYGKEIVLGDDAHSQNDVARQEQRKLEVVEQWKQGTLETLGMIGPGDILAIKFTGAGPLALDALRARLPMPPPVAAAMDEICAATARQGSRVWLDAEQQALQHCADDWTIELMRKHNRDGRILVYNTIQAYLKRAWENAERHVRLAAAEGWGLGVKLVRGAYIEHETRALIHDTKEETDKSYNDIAASFIAQRLPVSGEKLEKYPKSALFLATHNVDSVRAALKLYREQVEAGKPTPLLDCGQLQGMADEVSCELLQQNEEYAARSSPELQRTIPTVFKCLAWGSVSECTHFLYRRAIENRGAVTRTRHMAMALRKELWRRLFSRV